MHQPFHSIQFILDRDVVVVVFYVNARDVKCDVNFFKYKLYPHQRERIKMKCEINDPHVMQSQLIGSYSLLFIFDVYRWKNLYS